VVAGGSVTLTRSEGAAGPAGSGGAGSSGVGVDPHQTIADVCGYALEMERIV
jgi:hypothetical protein